MKGKWFNVLNENFKVQYNYVLQDKVEAHVIEYFSPSMTLNQVELYIYNNRQSKNVRSLMKAREYVEKEVEKLLIVSVKNDLLMDLRKNDYVCERCDDIFNIFRYKNRKGRCKCGGKINQRYPQQRPKILQTMQEKLLFQ